MSADQTGHLIDAVIAFLSALTLLITTINHLRVANLSSKVDCIQDPAECGPQTGSEMDTKLPK